MSKGIGRNDPCPCGSGKKYKKCCFGKEGHDAKVEVKSKYRFEAGSYGEIGNFMPSIACLKLTQNGDWIYHFVLVNPNQVIPDEDQAVMQANDDLSVAFESKNKNGTDAALAMELKNKGYISVNDFNIVGSSELQAISKYEKLQMTIGFSGFILHEECYEYIENACHITDSKESATQFMLNCGYDEDEYKIDAISFADIMKDYGSSLGEYTMDKKAFQNFKTTAENNSVKYAAKEFYLDETLMVVNVNIAQKA